MNITHKETEVFKTSYLTFDVEGKIYKVIHIDNISDDSLIVVDDEIDEEIDDETELYEVLKQKAEKILNITIGE